jgi:2-hydroxy-3-keto-5-methylthiopentenyl-1-phosphate phosphatase
VQTTIEGSPAKLVLDWDGTVTERDTLVEVILRFGDRGVFERAEAELGRQLTLHEVIALEVQTLEASLEEMADHLVASVPVRPGFRALAERHGPMIVSAGFHELIEPVLARERVALEVRANRLERNGSGWRARFRDTSPCAVCGEACKRAAVLDGNGPVIFVGDGVSDRCAALGASRVFARDGLARWLDAQGAAYEPWDDFEQVSERL